MKRITSLIIAGFMAAALFAGCGQKPASTAGDTSTQTSTQTENTEKEQPKKLEGKISLSTNMTNFADTTITALAKDFMSKNPGTTVEIEGIKDHDNVLMTRIAAGELPDISIIVDSKVSKNNYPQYFLPLDDLGFNKNDILFYEAGAGEDGKIYGLSDSVNYLGVTYNKKAFADAGITAVPKTMDELYAACEKLKAKGITPLGTAFKDGWTLYPYENHEYWNASFTGDPNSKSPYIDKDEIVDEVMLKGWNTLREFNKKGYLEKDLVSAGWDQMKKDISSGKIAMFYAQTWFPPQVVEGGAKQEDVGMFPWPESKYTPADKGKMWAIAKTSKYPELAKTFLKYLIQDGKYAKAVNVISALKTVENTDPAVKELLGYKLPIVETKPNSSNLTNALNKAELDLQKIGNEYVVIKDDAAAAKLIKTTNEKWAKVRKEFGGK